MGVAALLIVAGIIVWLLINPLIGIILLIAGILFLIWAGMSFRSGYTGYGGPHRYWY